MPYCPLPGYGSLYFERIGKGQPILATHGFSETGRYWTRSPVGAQLADRFELITLDMRGHGRTTSQAVNPEYTIDVLVDDIDRLADHLGLESFHLLGHATGSVVALRYAMRNRPRLSSLAVTSAASATAMIAPDQAENERFFGRMANFYQTNSWPQIVEAIKGKPWPFLHALDKHADADKLWHIIIEVFQENDPQILADFTKQFYTDPDPKLEGLGSIRCPVLIVSAEHDDLMRDPSKTIAQEIAHAVHIDLKGVGHMTALEAPKALSETLLSFFSDSSNQG